TVNQEDMGKVIGREGRTAKAIRSLLRVFGARASARINLKIVEPDGGEVAIAPDVDSNADKAEQPIAEQPSSEQPSSEQATEVI
ncbi:MAG: KH domain-containing protein, partial [Patescibacteria group bacterium]